MPILLLQGERPQAGSLSVLALLGAHGAGGRWWWHLGPKWSSPFPSWLLCVNLVLHHPRVLMLQLCSSCRCSRDGRNWSRPWASGTHRLLCSSPGRSITAVCGDSAAELTVPAHRTPLCQPGPHNSSWHCPCRDKSRTPGASRQAPMSTHFYLVFFLTVALSVPRLPRASP